VTTHLQLVPRSRKRGCIHPLLHTPLWRLCELVKHRGTCTVNVLCLFLCVGSCEENFKRLVIKKFNKGIRLLIMKDFVILMIILNSLINVRSTFPYVEVVKVSAR
jgi:hypothetical protein